MKEDKILPLKIENTYKIRLTPIGDSTKKIKLRKGDIIYLSSSSFNKKIMKPKGEK